MNQKRNTEVEMKQNKEKQNLANEKPKSKAKQSKAEQSKARLERKINCSGSFKET